jgi:hypothetical protein
MPQSISIISDLFTQHLRELWNFPNVMKIYCDTDTLFHDVKRQQNVPKNRKELLALEKLLARWEFSASW